MDYKLLDKLKALLFFLSGNYLVFAGIYAKGHPVVAGIVAILLLFISLAFVIFDRDYFPGLDLPDDICTLGVDILIIVLAILYFCFDDEEPGVTFMPIMILLVGGAALDIVRLVGTGAFKNKSFKEIFNEQLHLPLFLDVVLLFWPLYHGFTEGWDSVHTIEFVGIGFFAFDLIHNLIILPTEYRRQKRIVREYLQQLENEKESLASVNTDAAGLDEETKQLVIDRIDLIDNILIGKMAGNAVYSRKVNKEIEKVIADRTSFIESLALHYAVSHPQAIEQLQQSGLSRYEIGLCCLYHMGYNGKEVKDITDTSMIYHVNSTIRQKLGLKTNDVNLSTFIRELFATG